MMWTLFTRAAALAGLLTLAGCAGPGINLSDYHKEVSLPAAARLPSESDLNRQGRARVVVFETDDGNLDKARQAQVDVTLTREIEQILGDNGAEVIDRRIASNLGQELQLAEVKGVGVYDGPAVANYAVKPTITLAEYESKYVPASSYTDKKGKTHEIAAYYAHKANVQAGIRVYEIPSLHLLKSLSGRGSSSSSTADRGARELSANLIRGATQGALRDMRNEFLNLFAPKGYVLSRRDKDKKSILRVSIGSEQGIVPGNSVIIFSEQESIHPITHKVSYNKIPVVEGTVSEIVTPQEAWIIPEDEDKAKRVRLGDLIEVVYKDSLWSRLLGR
jgi:hypothetical protein